MKSTLERINHLKDPESVDKLTDLFQEMGIPMGSDEWANITICRLHRLLEAEKTLGKVLSILKEVEDAKKRDNQELWLKVQKQHEERSSRRCEERDNYVPKDHPNSWICKCGKSNFNIQTHCWDCKEKRNETT